MGYFSQRKKYKREGMFLGISLFFIAMFLLLRALFQESFVGVFVEDYLYHFYIFNMFLVLFAAIHGRIYYVLLSLLVLLWCYTGISSTANIFLSARIDNPTSFMKVSYAIDAPNKDILKSQPGNQIKYGEVRFSPECYGEYATYQKDGKNMTALRVDFSRLKSQHASVVFDNLAKFVSTRDEPLIIYGDFGLPSWSQPFKDFLRKTSLWVKNRVVVTDLQHRFNIFASPTINLLAYNNVGISDISVIKNNKDKNEVVFEVEYYFK